MSVETIWYPRVFQIVLDVRADHRAKQKAVGVDVAVESHMVIRVMRTLGYEVRSPSSRVELLPCEYTAVKALVWRDAVRMHNQQAREHMQRILNGEIEGMVPIR